MGRNFWLFPVLCVACSPCVPAETDAGMSDVTATQDGVVQGADVAAADVAAADVTATQDSGVTSDQGATDGATSACGPVTLSPAPPPNGPGVPSARLGQMFMHTFTATGSRPPYTFSVSQGALPSGLSLNSATGVLSGVPGGSANFWYTYSVAAVDSCSPPHRTDRTYNQEVVP